MPLCSAKCLSCLKHTLFTADGVVWVSDSGIRKSVLHWCEFSLGGGWCEQSCKSVESFPRVYESSEKWHMIREMEEDVWMEDGCPVLTVVAIWTPM